MIPRSSTLNSRLLLPLLLAVFSPAATAAEPPPQHPNLLLICVDDLKPILGCYGDPAVKTPNLDRLAARALRFERAFCNQAVCSPSRNALLTSLRPQTLGIYDLATNFRIGNPAAVTIGQHFRSHGYFAESLGKIFHVGHGNQDDSASWNVPAWKPKSPQYALPQNAADPAAGKDAKGMPWEAADVPDNRYADGQIADEAIQRLRSARERNQPFFLAVGFLKPHLPFVAPQKYWDLYDRQQFTPAKLQTPPAGAPDWAPQFGGELRSYRSIPASGNLPDQLQKTLLHGYHAAISYMDAQAGRLLDELDRLQLTPNTIIVLWGDHGWHLGDHGIWCKHTNYEQAARIPLLIAAPAGPQGKLTDSLVETVDVFPTLAELAGLPAPPNVDGRSFAQLLKNPDTPHRDHVIHVYPRNAAGRGQMLGRAIRTAQHRLVEWKPIGGPENSAVYELYDYSADPDEHTNLAEQQPDLVRSLRKLLDSHPTPRPQVANPQSQKSKSTPKSKSASNQDRSAMFARRDTNGDGQLTKAEFLAQQPDPDQAPDRFLKFDVNQDGVLSRNEFVTSGAKP